jgi:hypothetical protein
MKKVSDHSFATMVMLHTYQKQVQQERALLVERHNTALRTIVDAPIAALVL